MKGGTMDIKISKAIEILHFNIKEAKPKMPPDCEASVRLGIEALKAVKDSGNRLDRNAIPLLPGEEAED